jgi:hypothetical protein
MPYYNYRLGAQHLGVGVNDLALLRTNAPPREGMYDPSRMVRKSFAMQAPAYAMIGQRVVPVSLLGATGTTLFGQFAMTTLAQSK